MFLRRLLYLRPFCRHCSTKPPYPFHSYTQTSTADGRDNPPESPTYIPNYRPHDPPPYPDTGNPHQTYSPISSYSSAAAAPNNLYINQKPTATAESGKYYYNQQYSSANYDPAATNYSQYSNPAAANDPQYSNPTSANYSQYSNPAAANYSQYSNPAGTSHPQFPAFDAANSAGDSHSRYPTSAATTNSEYPPSAAAGDSQFSASAATDNCQFPFSSTSNSTATSQFSSPTFTTTKQAATGSSTPFVPQRSYGFSSAEEAAAERRRRKRRLRIEPPLYALRPNPQTSPNANNPDMPRLPDSTSALVGLRLNLHNRVQSLIRAGDLDSASYVARQSVFQYTRPTVFTCNAIIAAMYRAKRYNDAKTLFQYFFRQFDIIPNIVSYNNLIVSHCESSEIEDALKVYEYILENAPYSPSAVTYRHLTKGLIDAGRMDDAVSLLREMLHKGHGADSLVYNNVILGHLNLGNLEKANELFDELKERCTVYDGVVNATFMDWFFNQGKPKEAMESYRDLMSRNYRMVPATRNVLLETLLKHGKKKEAWDLFHDMLDDHTPPTFQAVNSDTVNMMVNEYLKEGNVEEAMDVFKRSGKGIKSKPFQMDVAGFNNMIARMSELDMMDEAEQYYKQLCDKSLSPDVNTYKTLVEAYIKLDRVDNMLEKYIKMVEAGLRVIPPYANKWFGYLIDKGKASDCLPILSKMVDREPKPDVTTYETVARGLVEYGNFDATSNLLSEMVIQGIGTTASLEEFMLDAFERVGRRPEIESVLNKFHSQFAPQRPYFASRSPPRVTGLPHMTEQGGRTPAMPWQTASAPQVSYPDQFAQQTHQPQMTEQTAHQQQMPQQEAEVPRVAGQHGF